MHAIDPELVEGLAMFPAIDRSDPVGARREIAQRTASKSIYEPSAPLTITDLQFAGLSDGHVVAVRLFRPSDMEGRVPAVLWIHGGGFTLGSVDLDANVAAEIAAEVGVVVASVEYRLAPEHPYPAALDDCYAALRWLHEKAGQLGIDPQRICVSGESAGACLAAAIAIRARDEAGPPITSQLLFTPVLDDRLDTHSMRTYTDTPVWNRRNATLSWAQYLGELADADDLPAYAAPARISDVSGLPAAYVVVCEFDPLRDEGVDYAMRLVQSGIRTELHLYPGTFHGSNQIANARVSRRMNRDRLEAFHRIMTETYGTNDEHSSASQ